MSGRCLNCFGSVNRPASYAGAVEEQRAWFGRRVVAFLVDWFASVLVALLAFPQFPYGSNGSMLATLAVFVVEITVLTWLTGASFGQRLVRLRVVSIDGGCDADSTGAPMECGIGWHRRCCGGWRGASAASGATAVGSPAAAQP